VPGESSASQRGGKLLLEIKPSDADRWVLHLKNEGYAAATTGRTIKGARQFFKAACREEVIARNPFEHLKAGSHANKARLLEVTQEQVERILESCPDIEWRLLIALSRYGGLRVPSEALALMWSDVDWERQRFLVRSPKTEHHANRAERWVPLFPELRPHFERAFEQAPEGGRLRHYTLPGRWGEPSDSFPAVDP
jgi:integrase